MNELTKAQLARASTPGGFLVLTFAVISGVLLCVGLGIEPDEIQKWIDKRSEVAFATLVLILVVAVVAIDQLTAMLAPLALRAYSGSWIPDGKIREKLVKRRVDRASKADREWRDSIEQSPKDRSKQSLLYLDLKWRTTDETIQAPFRIGEIMNVGQARSSLKFGITLDTALRHLELFVDSEAQERQDTKAKSVLLIAQASMISLLTLPLICHFWPVVFVPILVFFGVRLVLPARIRTYFDGAEALVDTYRIDLYKQLGFAAPPDDAKVEIPYGNALENFVRGGRVTAPLERSEQKETGASEDPDE